MDTTLILHYLSSDLLPVSFLFSLHSPILLTAAKMFFEHCLLDLSVPSLIVAFEALQPAVQCSVLSIAICLSAFIACHSNLIYYSSASITCSGNTAMWYSVIKCSVSQILVQCQKCFSKDIQPFTIHGNTESRMSIAHCKILAFKFVINAKLYAYLSLRTAIVESTLPIWPTL